MAIFPIYTINNNLLQQSLYIFDTLINSASKDGCIGDYCTLKSGFAFKSKWWQDSGIPVIKIGSINQDYLNLSNCSHVSEDKISLAKDFIVSGGDLLIAMTGATIGKFTMVPKMHKTILVNQRVGKFFLGENPINKIPFIYCTLKQPEIISEIINRGQGSAQPNISASDIMSIPCVIPQTDEINNFNLQTAPMFELIINNQVENLILAKTRDLLLLRLMSGEIDISNIGF
ncbi:MAG: restriction endonuclease subunit S [Veillonella sp.]